jgi:3-oxoacyl-[acyl-carrier protein] reductase
VALITGSSGTLGAAIAEELAAMGFTVVLHGFSRIDELSALSNRLSGATTATADLTEWVEARDLVSLAEEKGRLEVVINCAGAMTSGLLGAQSREDWLRPLNVNVLSTYHVCRAAVPGMVRRRSGRIINMSSAAGILASPGQTGYSASKAAIVGLTKSLAAEIGRRGVTVNTLAPGFIESRMTADVPESVRHGLLARVPLGRVGTAGEIAQGVRFLVECSYITGQVIAIDGGLTA